MKILKKGSEFKLVPDKTKKDYMDMRKLVTEGGWKHCDRDTWRRECRDVNKSKKNKEKV